MKLAYDEIGSGEPFLLLHGFPLSGKMWSETAEAISSKGYRVILPDLRGFGESRCGDEIVPIENMAKDVAQLLDFLKIEKSIIGGLSMGGYVTFNLLRIFPKKFRALILCDTNYTSEPKENLPARQNLVDEIEKHGTRALVDQMLPMAVSEYTKLNNPDLISALTDEFLACSASSAAAAIRGIASRKDHTATLSKIDVPTILIFGQEDKITNVESAEKMASQIQGAKLSVIPNAGHLSNLENPQVFNSTVLEFLRSINN